MNLKNYNIDKSWTLFLDRDGVINKRIPDNYVLNWNQFEFLPGVLEALKIFNTTFGKIIVVTNQQGIGRGMMVSEELEIIHKKMIKTIDEVGGRVDKVYFAPHLKESNHPDRKPNVGMGLKAKKDFPDINFKKSIIAGDSFSDMEFGHRLGMLNCLINESGSLAKAHPDVIRFWARDLKEFSTWLLNSL
jgi:histidinol-phosphate phosphatase family protein